MSRIVVIGAGFGGLAAAIRLRTQGHNVTLLEKRDKPGGRAYVFEQDGFTFDAGPTIITAPWLIDELFVLAGRQTRDYVSLVPIDPYYNVRFTDGSVFRYNGDQRSVVEQVRAFNPDDVDGYRRFSASTERIFNKGFALIDKPFTHLSDMVRVLPDIAALGAHKSVASYVNGFIKDERLRQVFSFHPLLVGGNPFQSTSIYALIHHLEKKWGVWFAMGGTGALVNAFARLFSDVGGTMHLGAEVDEIVIDDSSRRAKGVRLKNGEWFDADVVVSNGDVATTYMQLIAPKYRAHNNDRRVKGRKYSMSLFVAYFGTDRRYENMAHHEIIMGPRYKGLLDEIFHAKTLADDFSLYVHRPTATDPSLAPPGCDSWYVLSPVPHLGGDIDWASAARPYRDRIMHFLETHYMSGLTSHIVSEHIVDPRYFRDDLNSYLGNAFAIQPTLMQSAWMRPHNVSEDIPNLYFAGAGTHPGAGLPGVISSGKIVADLIGAAGAPNVTRTESAAARA